MEDFESGMLYFGGLIHNPLHCEHNFFGNEADEAFTCLHADCPWNNSLNSIEQQCPICLCDLVDQECLMLGCRHVFHTACVRNQLANGYPGPAISFAFMSCVMCRTPIQHKLLNNDLHAHQQLFDLVKACALKQLALEFDEEHKDIVSEGGKFYKQPEEFALHNYTFYKCDDCTAPLFGGRRNCGLGAAAQEEEEGNRGTTEKKRFCNSCSKANCEEEEEENYRMYDESLDGLFAGLFDIEEDVVAELFAELPGDLDDMQVEVEEVEVEERGQVNEDAQSEEVDSGGVGCWYRFMEHQNIVNATQVEEHLQSFLGDEQITSQRRSGTQEHLDTE